MPGAESSKRTRRTLMDKRRAASAVETAACCAFPQPRPFFGTGVDSKVRQQVVREGDQLLQLPPRSVTGIGAGAPSCQGRMLVSGQAEQRRLTHATMPVARAAAEADGREPRTTTARAVKNR